jgi:hypothetical protein
MRYSFSGAPQWLLLWEAHVARSARERGLWRLFAGQAEGEGGIHLFMAALRFTRHSAGCVN